MADNIDPLELFARLNPVPDETALTPTSEYPPAQQLLARLLADTDAPLREARRRRRRRWIVGGTVVGVLGVASGAAALVLTSRPADNPLTVACYAGPSLDAEITEAQPRQGQTAVEACAEVWRTGVFAGRGEAPTLVGCVLQSGIAGVFPSDAPDLCDALGLSPLADQPATDDPVVGLQETLSAEFGARGCVPPDEARALAQAELDRRGLDRWKILDPGPYSADRTCATLAFDPAERTITFIPRPPPPPTNPPPGGTIP